jgi:hypothetical protein
VTSIPVRILVSELAGEDPGSLEIAVREYVTQLLADLAIAAPAAVEVHSASGALQAGTFSLAIGAQPPLVEDDAGRGMEAAIPLAVYRRRRFFITGEVAAAKAAALWPDATPLADLLDRLRTVMLDCADRNVSLGRLDALLPRNPAAGWDPWDVVCRVHTDDRVAIEVSAKGLDPSLSWTAMQMEVFAATGLICPIPVSAEGTGLAEEEYQIRINDLHLPVQSAPASSFQEAAVAFVRDSIVATPLALVTRDAIQQRVTFAARAVPASPVLVEQVVGRLGIQQLCACVARLAAGGTPVWNFPDLLDRLSHEVARFAPEESSIP